MGCAGLEGSVGVGDGAAGVVVEMRLNVAVDDACISSATALMSGSRCMLTAKGADEVVDHPGGGSANSVGNTNTVDACGIDGLVEGQDVDEVRSERVL